MLYPKDLQFKLREVWNPQLLGKGWPRVELPTDAILTELLEVCYHASFLTEEGRPTTFRVVLLTKSTKINFNEDAEPPRAAKYTFLNPLSFTAAELRRLAPASDPIRTLIAIEQVRQSSGDLQITGIIDIGSTLWAMSRHEKVSGQPPPEAVVIASTSPGNLTISRGNRPVLRLMNGAVAIPVGSVLRDGPVGRFFRPAENWFVNTARRKANEVSDKKSEALILAYSRFLEMLLIATSETGHGGTLLFIPDRVLRDDRPLRKTLHIKYETPHDEPMQVVLGDMVASSRYFQLLFSLYDRSSIRRDTFELLEDLNLSREDARDAVSDMAKHLGGLTAVDGAVVLTDKLKLVGFGAEVLAGKSRMVSVRSSKSVAGETFSDEPIAGFGTRHRSAFRFCSTVKPSVAFVLSQDGGVKAVTSVGDKVVMWPYFEIGYKTGL